MSKNDGSLYEKMGLTKEEIAAAGTHDHAGRFRKRVRGNLSTMDSLLSLLYHRYVPKSELDSVLRRDIEDAITECRKLQKELQK